MTTARGFTATPIEVLETDLGQVAFDDRGLVPAVVQDFRNGRVLMVAWMDATALRRTLETGRMWYWSRSRQEYWCKGETSGDRQWVRRAFFDCDGDTLLFEVDQEGRGACHTGDESCFHREFGSPARSGPEQRGA